MENISREQIDECCAFLDRRTRDDEGVEVEPGGLRSLVTIALTHNAKGLRGRKWREATEQEFRAVNDENVGSIMVILTLFSILLTMIRIWLEWRRQ